MKRTLIAAFFTLCVGTVAVCQSREPPYEKGDAAELRGVTKVFLTPDRNSQKKIEETIKQRLPHLEFVSNPIDAEVWLSLALAPRFERSRVPPNPNDAVPIHWETSDLSYEAVGRILRIQRNQPPRLINLYKGRGSDRGTLSKNFAKDFVRIYEGANVGFKPALGTQPATRLVPATKEIGPSAAEEAASSDVEVLRVNTDLVSINVSVIDRNSRFISTLPKDAFSVYDKGVKQELSFFASIEEPFTVALLIDTSRSVKFKLQDIVNAANAFVEQLRPDDRLMVMTFDSGIREIVKTARSGDVRGQGFTVTFVDGSETLLYDTVSFAVKERLNRIRGRKAIIVLTDGVSSEGGATYKSSIRDAEEAGALVYAIQFDTYNDATEPFKGSSATRMWNLQKLLYRRASSYLEELASKTGGQRYRAGDVSDFPQAFRSIVKDLSSQYSLGFYPRPLPQHGERRRVKVAVNLPNVAVRARRDYIFTTR
jgi:Ca-activated chloride channel family protein